MTAHREHRVLFYIFSRVKYLEGISSHFLACRKAYGAVHHLVWIGMALISELHHAYLHLGEPQWALDHIFSPRFASYRPMLHVLFILKAPYRAGHDVFLT